MSEFQINLPDAIGEYVGAQIAAGRFASPDQYVQALVAADQQHQKITREISDDPHVASLLEEGLASEPGRHWSPEVLAELKQKVTVQTMGKNP
ncbi:ribbon-helix-helix domain-containing protein [Bythopirellula goksoeyrii]|uniref:Antitoxin ParD4 n=1 Tax=Bythopirellula goksoeyrii TaxID=1400387 RepID=A0A5B9QCN9_9BACT|nr:hypothetical protein [Bythopirellula goksoeyrii]QEG35569.1 Antitoxin ParD4 [Bythopirellula goksoeyrii]